MTPSNNKLTLTFDRLKTTPGTVCFDERTKDGASPAVGRLYVKKAKMDFLGDPDHLTVTIEGKQGARAN